jgi:hypothetical protein
MSDDKQPTRAEPFLSQCRLTRYLSGILGVTGSRDEQKLMVLGPRNGNLHGVGLGHPAQSAPSDAWGETSGGAWDKLTG